MADPTLADVLLGTFRRLRDQPSNAEMIAQRQAKTDPLERISRGASADEVYGPQEPPSGLAKLLAHPKTQEFMNMAMFLGPGAKIAPRPQLAQAERMAAANAPREAIWRETGWFQGPDKKWRFEIDDSKSVLSNRAQGELSKYGSAAGRELEAGLDHPELFSAYPKLKKTVWSIWDGPEGGSFVESAPGYPSGSVRASGANTKERQSTLLHELQHAIQGEEGFAVSTHPSNMERYVKQDAPHLSQEDMLDAAYAAYRRHTGEVEARAVESRMNLTPEQRRARAPWLDYEIPEAQQIVRFEGRR